MHILILSMFLLPGCFADKEDTSSEGDTDADADSDANGGCDADSDGLRYIDC